MSQKIINALDSGDFRRNGRPFKLAVFESALSQGLVSFDKDRGLYHHKGRVLLGLLPEPDGRFAFLD